MSVINISSYNADRLYRSMYPRGSEMRDQRLSRRYLPVNRAQDSALLGSGVLQYVNSIKAASASLSDSLKDLDDDFIFFNTKSVEDLAYSYNSLYYEAFTNSSDPKAESLAARMLRISATHAESLKDIGIDFDQYGMMTVDARQLDESAKNGNLEQFFSMHNSKSYGFTNQLAKLAGNVTHNTSNFVSKYAFGNNLTENFTYTSLGTFAHDNTFNTGLIFDYSF